MVRATLFLMQNALYFHISTFRRIYTVPNMGVLSSSLISCFLVMLLWYFLNEFEMIPLDCTITFITFVFFFSRALYFYCKALIF